MIKKQPSNDSLTTNIIEWHVPLPIGRLFEAYRQNKMKVHDPLYIKSNNERIDKIKPHVTMFSTWQNYKNNLFCFPQTLK